MLQVTFGTRTDSIEDPLVEKALNISREFMYEINRLHLPSILTKLRQESNRRNEQCYRFLSRTSISS